MSGKIDFKGRWTRCRFLSTLMNETQIQGLRQRIPRKSRRQVASVREPKEDLALNNRRTILLESLP